MERRWQMRRALNVATSCTNLVRFGSVTPEFHNCSFVYLYEKNGKNWHIRSIILKHARPMLTKFSAWIDMYVMMINLTFVLRSLKGRCYGNQLIGGSGQIINID